MKANNGAPLFFDSHCHVHFAAYAQDKEAVISRSLEAGVWMVLVGTNFETSREAVRLAEKYERGVYATIGLHPGHLYESHHDPHEFISKPVPEHFLEEQFAKLASSSKVVGVGETGLDYFRLPPEKSEELCELQRQNFREHIHFARSQNLPLIIHLRNGASGAKSNATQDVLDILHREAHENGLRGVFHCFSGSADDVARYSELGFYISFAGNVTYPSKNKIGLTAFSKEKENQLYLAARAVPATHLLTETDAPYLSPVPHRGKRNEPLNVQYVCEGLAAARGVSVQEIAAVTVKNALTLFGLAA